MLVVISDLHLTDKTSGEVISEKAFRIFRNRVSDMAYDASWRTPVDKTVKHSGDYQPLTELNILLLGDIIDMIRSEKWNNLPENDMPWTEDRKDSFFKTIDKIVEDVLDENKVSLSILKDISVKGVTIPASMQVLSEEEKLATKTGSKAGADHMVRVNIYYMVGNHDWFLCINDPRMHPVRNRIIDTLGLANKPNEPFPFSPDDNKDLWEIQTDHNVYALHGDKFDKTNYQSKGRDFSSVGDVIVLKLLNEIPKQIEKLLRESLPDQKHRIIKYDDFVKELREIDNLRPYTLAPQWIAYVIEKYELDVKLVNESIRGAIRELIDNFIKNSLVSRNAFTVMEMQLAGLLFKTDLGIADLATVIHFFTIDKDRFDSYRKYARSMNTEVNGRNKFFYVMGHTHYPELVPMSSFSENGQTYNQIYINTGTWRTLHKTGLYDDSFISYKTMNIAAFYKGNERGGHHFENWTGYLDL